MTLLGGALLYLAPLWLHPMVFGPDPKIVFA